MENLARAASARSFQREGSLAPGDALGYFRHPARPRRVDSERRHHLVVTVEINHPDNIHLERSDLDRPIAE